MSTDCIFCNKSKIDNNLPYNYNAYARYDEYPVSPLHMLVIPRKHYDTYFDMPYEVKQDCIKLIDDVVQHLKLKSSNITGFNIGINCGSSAGQTIMHTHIHVIPRYDNDVQDPRGGVRHCIPNKGYYTTHNSL